MITLEQIEVAADAMIAEMFAPHEIPVDAELKAKYRQTARAALEAVWCIPALPFDGKGADLMRKTPTRVELPAAAVQAVDAIAAARGLSRAASVLLAIGFLQAAEKARAEGMCVGAAMDREALDLVITPRAAP